MLTQLLPGFRGLRTPLATGVLWLLSLWVLAGDRLPSRAGAGGFVARVYGLAEQVGRPTVGTALLFAAYLLGSVLVLPANSLLREPRRDTWLPESVLPAPWPLLHGRPALLPRGRAALPAWGAFDNTRLLTRQAQTDLRMYVRSRPLLVWLESVLSPAHGDAGERILLGYVLDEIDQLGTRLHAQNSTLYEDQDRLSAEADLRVNTGTGLGVLTLALSVRVSPAFLLLLLVPAVLVLTGLRRARQSNDVIIQALVIGEVTSSALAEADGVLERLRAGEGEEAGASAGSPAGASAGEGPASRRDAGPGPGATGSGAGLGRGDPGADGRGASPADGADDGGGRTPGARPGAARATAD